MANCTDGDILGDIKFFSNERNVRHIKVQPGVNIADESCAERTKPGVIIIIIIIMFSRRAASPTDSSCGQIGIYHV
jgi:hypothetical protein